MPVYKTNRDEITTQYDMNALERIGLLKMDFLGLTTLTVLQDTARMIEKNRGIKVDIDNLTLDDEQTYKLFSRGDTTAIFQFESHGMRDILRRYQPSRIVPSGLCLDAVSSSCMEESGCTYDRILGFRAHLELD